MTEKGMGVTRTVLATVIGAALVGAAATLFAYFLPGNELAIAMFGVAKWAWAGVVYVATRAWHLINAPVPLWAFVLLGLLCVQLWRRRARPPGTSTISEYGRSLVEVLATADGNPLELDVLAITLGWARIGVETLADELRSINIVEIIYGYGGTVFTLTTAGKRYALAERLTGTEALRTKLRAAIDQNRRQF
jgi:hypothetical protein